jgi:hypothetical protein
MKAELKRVLQFLIIATTTVTVLIVTFHCISMIDDKFKTTSFFNLMAEPIMVIGFIDLLIFVPSTLVFGFIYVNKYNTDHIEVNWTNDKELAYVHS